MDKIKKYPFLQVFWHAPAPPMPPVFRVVFAPKCIWNRLRDRLWDFKMCDQLFLGAGRVQLKILQQPEIFRRSTQITNYVTGV